MKIKAMKLTNLRGEEHFQFGADVLALVKATGPVALHVEAAYNAFTAAHAQEDEVLEQIRKSVLTGRIADADRARDDVFYGLSEAVRSATHHFTPAMREAAEGVSIVFHSYGAVASRNYAEQTAAVHNLLVELTTNHAAACETLGLNGWIGELDRLNIAVEKLMSGRDDETAGRTDLVMKDVRARADEAYRLLTGQIEALGVVAAMQGEGSTVGPASVYESFIAALNARIERYGNVMAVRRGRAAAEKAREEEAAAAAAGIDVETWRAMQKAAAAAEKASKLVAAASATAAVVEQAGAATVEVVGNAEK
jgi:hypothetical protein